MGQGMTDGCPVSHTTATGKQTPGPSSCYRALSVTKPCARSGWGRVRYSSGGDTSRGSRRKSPGEVDREPREERRRTVYREVERDH
jgi:hypothetical protein